MHILIFNVSIIQIDSDGLYIRDIYKLILSRIKIKQNSILRYEFARGILKIRACGTPGVLLRYPYGHSHCILRNACLLL